MSKIVCYECDRINIRFDKKGTHIDFLSGGDVVQTQSIPTAFNNPGDTLTITSMNFFVRAKDE